MKRLVPWVALALWAASGNACRGAHGGGVESPDAGTTSQERTQEASLPVTLAVFENPDGRRVSFRVEVASTPDQRERGLMFRRELGADRGMVFVFPREEPQTFWMKNTYVPLDMIFVASDGQVVGVVENARPLTLDPRTVEGAARMVLEVPAFGARRAGIGPGSRVRFDPPLPEVRR
ncbi:MAG TPA: DUF192 domain-containing protein [Myxococcota bacterium]|nr:DUF192 domain-containing protein [Myxococcota bacterium]HQK52280.1 DUF192 domain-containing protein [Myxococcota bacterium]